MRIVSVFSYVVYAAAERADLSCAEHLSLALAGRRMKSNGASIVMDLAKGMPVRGAAIATPCHRKRHYGVGQFARDFGSSIRKVFADMALRWRSAA